LLEGRVECSTCLNLLRRWYGRNLLSLSGICGMGKKLALRVQGRGKDIEKGKKSRERWKKGEGLKKFCGIRLGQKVKNSRSEIGGRKNHTTFNYSGGSFYQEKN